MNKARMRILAEVLNGAELPDNFKFDMANIYDVPGDCSTTGPKCGTAGCIAGLAIHLFGSRDPLASTNEAKRLLKLTSKEAGELFFINSMGVDLEKVTKKQAAAVLLHAAKTGKIDWRKAPKLPIVKDE